MDIQTMQINLEVNIQDVLSELFKELSLKDVYEVWGSEAEKAELKEYLNGKIN